MFFSSKKRTLKKQRQQLQQLESVRDRIALDLESLEICEKRLINKGQAANSRTDKLRIASQISNLRRDKARLTAQHGIIAKQAGILSSHFYHLDIAKQGEENPLPSDVELVTAATRAEDVVSELAEKEVAVFKVALDANKEVDAILAEFEEKTSAPEASPMIRETDLPDLVLDWSDKIDAAAHAAAAEFDWKDKIDLAAAKAGIPNDGYAPDGEGANGIHRIRRKRYLTPEEVAKYNLIREQVKAELPDLLKRHDQRMKDKSSGLIPGGPNDTSNGAQPLGDE